MSSSAAVTDFRSSFSSSVQSSKPNADSNSSSSCRLDAEFDCSFSMSSSSVSKPGSDFAGRSRRKPRLVKMRKQSVPQFVHPKESSFNRVDPVPKVSSTGTVNGFPNSGSFGRSDNVSFGFCAGKSDSTLNTNLESLGAVFGANKSDVAVNSGEMLNRKNGESFENVEGMGGCRIGKNGNEGFVFGASKNYSGLDSSLENLGLVFGANNTSSSKFNLKSKNGDRTNKSSSASYLNVSNKEPECSEINGNSKSKLKLEFGQRKSRGNVGQPQGDEVKNCSSVSRKNEQSCIFHFEKVTSGSTLQSDKLNANFVFGASKPNFDLGNGVCNKDEAYRGPQYQGPKLNGTFVFGCGVKGKNKVNEDGKVAEDENFNREKIQNHSGCWNAQKSDTDSDGKLKFDSTSRNIVDTDLPKNPIYKLSDEMNSLNIGQPAPVNGAEKTNGLNEKSRVNIQNVFVFGFNQSASNVSTENGVCNSCDLPKDVNLKDPVSSSGFDTADTIDGESNAKKAWASEIVENFASSLKGSKDKRMPGETVDTNSKFGLSSEQINSFSFSAGISGKENQPINFNNEFGVSSELLQNRLNSDMERDKMPFPLFTPESFGSQHKVDTQEALSGHQDEKKEEFSFPITPFIPGNSFSDFSASNSSKSFSFTANLFSGVNEKLGCGTSSRLRDKKVKKKKLLRQETLAQRLAEQTDLSNENSSMHNDQSPGCCSAMNFLPYQDTIFSTSADNSTRETETKDDVVANKDTPVFNDSHKKCGEGNEKFSGTDSGKDSDNQRDFSSYTSPSAQDGLSSIRRQYRKKYKLKVDSGSNNLNHRKVEFSTDAVQHSSFGRKSSANIPSGVRSHMRNKGIHVSKVDEDHGMLGLTDSEACEKWRIRGNQAYKAGNLSQAEDLYTKGIQLVSAAEISGSCLEPLLLCYSNRAATRMSLRRMREAICDCASAAALDPHFLKVKLRAANCYLVLGEVEEAIKHYNNCLESRINLCLDRRITIEAAEGLQKAQAEVRKREEKEAAEALKREQELREAKRQQQRLNFLLSQTELYSHFMQNKSTLPSEAVNLGDETINDPEMLLSSTEVRPGEEEDPEEAELRKEALKAAQDAVSKQKMMTSAFDSECLKLRQAAEIEPSQQDAAAANIDLLHPSTMPVASTVQAPELFKGTLKDYQLKGLQWLVNCYEQGLNGILADEMGLGKTIQAMAFLAHLAEDKNIWGPFLVVAPASVLNNWADEIGRFCPDLKTLPYWGGLQERVVLRKNINPKRLYRRDAGFHILITSYQLLVSDEKYFRRVKWQYMVLDEAQAIKSSNSIRWKTLLSFNCRNRLLLTGTPVQNNMAELWALLHFIMPTLFDSHEQFNEWFSKGIENHAEHGGSLNEHQLSRLHAILKPFMLRRVKKDVVSELTGKTEITVHCKLSSRQQAFYQAIKNKISLAELIDSSRGHLNEKKILNLMNIVIQLRKVCNHPELFERNEGSSYFYFGDVPYSLLPAPFGELEDVFFSGGRSPVTYQIPKLVYRGVNRSSMLHSTVGQGLSKELFEKYFNIYSPENIHRSILQEMHDLDVGYLRSGTFGFTRLVDMSPIEVAFSATGSLLEKLLFSIVRANQQLLDEILDLMEPEDDDLCFSHLGRDKVRAVKRMLLLPSKSEANLLKTRLTTGPADSPLEALAMEHQDRLLSNVNLLHSIYSFIPRTRAPPINAHCSDRNFAYKMLEELHHPWIKRLLVGFARTSEYNGPRKPGAAHHLIQELDSELPITQPALQLTYQIFGSCPPMQPFDPAKMLTDSGKLQTVDILLKRLQAGNHRVLIFAQMTKMLDILEDYMHYRKYRYLRLDGSSTIMDRRDMVKDFQHRNDIFVFLLSTRAGGLGINLTAADTVIFYESDWNPTLDLQAMDRAHRLGQTKDVTVYLLICKETVEEKILQRASQKNTVQQLVMTGGHVQGDLLAPEDVVSLLIDDAQLEQKLKEIPLQAKERPRRKGGTKGICIGADGDASLEDLINSESVGNDALEPEKAKSSNKKRKGSTDKQTPRSRPQKNQKNLQSVSSNSLLEDDIDGFPQNIDMQQQRPKRLKRPTKSVNENLEPAFTATVPMNREGNHNHISSDISSGGGRAGAEEEALRRLLANNRTSEILYLLSSYRSFSSWGGAIADLEAEASYFPVERCSSRMRRKCRTVY